MRGSPTALAGLLAAGTMVVACSAGTGGSFESVGSAGPGPSDTLSSGSTVVRVDTGRWGELMMMPTLVEYLRARQASMRERRIVPDMVETATFQWIQRQRAVIADANRRGWTVPARARVRIVGVRPNGADAVVRVCMWGPSVDFVDTETGESVQPEVRQWYPFDVRMVQVGDRWYVSAAAEGQFGCEVGEG